MATLLFMLERKILFIYLFFFFFSQLIELFIEA